VTVLVDTSVWIDHWRSGDRRLAQLLDRVGLWTLDAPLARVARELGVAV
jgi:predicted nucleic acid-binding protein